MYQPLNSEAASEDVNRKMMRFRLIALGCILIITTISAFALVYLKGSLMSAMNVINYTHDVDTSVQARRLKLKDKDIPQLEDLDICDNPHYRDGTLKLAYENTYFGLLKKTYSQAKFEASDVRVLGEDIYVVCDSSWGLGKFNRDLAPFSGVEFWPNKDIGLEWESQWEALVHDERRGVFLAIQEAIPVVEGADAIKASVNRAANKLLESGMKHSEVESEIRKEEEKELAARVTEVSMKDHYHGRVYELQIRRDGTYNQVRSCNTEFAFPFGNKGFEGAVGVRDTNGILYLIAVCEGNFCDGSARGREAGNGRLVMMQLEEGLFHKDGRSKCRWKTVRVIKIPSGAAFQDYSAVAVRKNKVLIASQESSAVYYANLKGVNEDGLITDIFEFGIENDGRIFSFPRNQNCEVQYCNIEGVDFLNDRMIVAVSDRMKGLGRQSFKCFDKDQSLHVFQLPIPDEF